MLDASQKYFLDIRNEAHRRIICIKRPERGNAIGTNVTAQLLAALDDARTMTATQRVLVLTADAVSNGAHRTWVAGGDLKELAGLASGDEAAAYAAAMQGFCRGLDELPVVVVLAIDGAAIGGGAELAVAGDLRLATRASKLEWKQLRVGLPLGYGTAKRLVDLVGLGRAQALLYLGTKLSADEAEALGLVSAVYADTAELWAAIDKLCEELAALPAEAVAAQKAMFRAAVAGHPGAAAAAELNVFREAWGNPGHRAFLKKFTDAKSR